MSGFDRLIAYDWASSVIGLPPTDRLVLLTLASESGGMTSAEAISEYTGYDAIIIHKSLNDLSGYGLINIRENTIDHLVVEFNYGVDRVH